MADDRDARIAQLEAELSASRQREVALTAENVDLRGEREADRAEIERRDRALSEALEQQTATAEVLRVIASSPTDLQSVLDTIADSARRLCDAGGTHITR